MLDHYRAANPWMRLDGPPYVLPEDEPQIAAFNDRVRGTDYEINLNIWPDPFVGSPEAPIWLLNLNPGLDWRDLHHPPHVQAMQQKNTSLLLDSFWYLEDAYATTAGYEWWSKITSKLTKAYELQTLIGSLFCVELFPYHSVKFKAPKGLLPSQRYTLDLVRKGCQDGKRFIIMRRRRQWMNLVPALETATVLTLKNSRTPWLSLGNVDKPDLLHSWLSN